MIVSNKYQSEGIEPFIVFLPKCFQLSHLMMIKNLKRIVTKVLKILQRLRF